MRKILLDRQQRHRPRAITAQDLKGADMPRDGDRGPCSADKVFSAEELVIGPLLAREKSVGPRTTARFNTTSIRRTTRARHLENFFRKPHGAVATDDLQAIIREEVSRVG
jgi:hypothetical protein